MMLVDRFVGPGSIEGVGVFTAERIGAGACIWRFDDRFDRLIARNEAAELPEPLRRFLGRYGYALMSDPAFLVLESDNGRFMNHSEEPNTDFRDVAFGYALTDIEPGTELTCDYGEFDPGYDMHTGRHRRDRHDGLAERPSSDADANSGPEPGVGIRQRCGRERQVRD